MASFFSFVVKVCLGSSFFSAWFYILLSDEASPPRLPSSFPSVFSLVGCPVSSDPVSRMGPSTNMLAGELSRGAKRPRAIPLGQRVLAFCDHQRRALQGCWVHVGAYCRRSPIKPCFSTFLTSEGIDTDIDSLFFLCMFCQTY